MKTSRLYVFCGAGLALLGLILERIEESESSLRASQRFLSDRLSYAERIAAASHRESCAIWRGNDNACDCHTGADA